MFKSLDLNRCDSLSLLSFSSPPTSTPRLLLVYALCGTSCIDLVWQYVLYSYIHSFVALPILVHLKRNRTSQESRLRHNLTFIHVSFLASRTPRIMYTFLPTAQVEAFWSIHPALIVVRHVGMAAFIMHTSPTRVELRSPLRK